MVEERRFVENWLDEYLQELENLESALNSLGEIHNALAAEPGNTVLRDAGIRRFECTFDLAARWMTRRLRSKFPNADRWGYTRTIIESAAAGFLHNEAVWMQYQILREKKAHEYAQNEDNYDKVVDNIPNFAEDVRKLLNPPAPLRQARNQHNVAEHERSGTWVNDYVRSDGTPVKGHYRDDSWVRSHRRSNRQ